MSDVARALQSRDAATWNRFYTSNSRDLYGFIVRLVGGDRGTADEVFQETWLAAIDGIGSFDPTSGEPRAWVFGIARNRVILHWRRSKGAIAAAIAEETVTVGLNSNCPLLPEDCLIQLEQAAVVRAALLSMSPRHREVLIAKYVDGSQVLAIASAQGLTPKAVESLLARAREQLRGLLKSYFTGAPGEKQ